MSLNNNSYFLNVSANKIYYYIVCITWVKINYIQKNQSTTRGKNQLSTQMLRYC